AITWLKALADFNIAWAEEPTSPDDVLGHAAIRQAVAPMPISTGQHTHNRVIFKQLSHAGGVGLCELVQHLAMADYAAMSGTMEDRAIEFVDHLHEHFLDPARIRE